MYRGHVMNNSLLQLQTELISALKGLDATHTQLRPPKRPDKWSIQQIADHLLLSYKGTQNGIQARLAKGTPTLARPSTLQRFVQYTLTGLGYFPRGRKAPPSVIPDEHPEPLTGAQLSQLVEDHLTCLDSLFKDAEALFGGGRCISHPVLGPLSIHQWRRFQLIHGQHHIRQILAIRAAHNL